MSSSEVTATTSELPESRVRLEATVPAELLERSIEKAAKAVGRSMRIPGFRNGKVPAKIVVQRVGRDAIVEEAIRVDINTWYERAIRAANVFPIGQPTVDGLDTVPGEGEPLVFAAEVGVVPTADVTGVQELVVGKGEPQVDDAAIDSELEVLRERFARLENVTRPVANDDYVVIDFVGKLDGEPFEGGEGKGQLLQIGSGRFIPGFEEQLVGLEIGAETVITVTFPEDYGAPELAGQEATFDVKIDEVKAKELPELDDEFALEVGGVDTLEELRKDIAGRLAEQEEGRLEQLFRLAVLDAAVKATGVTVPDDLVQEHAHQEFHRMMHRFEHQGISQEIYLQSVGKTHDEVVEEAVPAARAQLLRQAVVSGLVNAGDISVSDAEIEEAVEPLAKQEKISVKKAIARLQGRGQLEVLRRDLAENKAVDQLVERAKVVSVEEAKKADTAWTPTREEQAENPGIWAN